MHITHAQTNQSNICNIAGYVILGPQQRKVFTVNIQFAIYVNSEQ